MLPAASERARRLAAVLQTIYLLGNEGHVGGDGDASAQVECAEEAIRLARLLVLLLPRLPEAEGLLALLLLTESRRAARRGPAGELIPLDEQDRDRWERARIAEGTALHAEAPDLERTDWAQILALYTRLLQITGSPVVALNRAVAVAMVHGPRDALAEVERLAAEPQLAMGHRLLAVRAHLLLRAGDRGAAQAAFQRAAALAVDPAERAYLVQQAERLNP